MALPTGWYQLYHSRIESKNPDVVQFRVDIIGPATQIAEGAGGWVAETGSIPTMGASLADYDTSMTFDTAPYEIFPTVTRLDVDPRYPRIKSFARITAIFTAPLTWETI